MHPAAIAAAVAIGMELKTEIEEMRDAMNTHSEAVQNLETAYDGLNEKLEKFNELKGQSLALAHDEAKQNIEAAKQEEARYKWQIDQKEKLLEQNRRYYGTDNLNSSACRACAGSNKHQHNKHASTGLWPHGKICCRKTS